MCILLFGKTKSEEVMEYFLNRISGDDEEEEDTPRVVINAEICRKIQRSCDADVIIIKKKLNFGVKILKKGFDIIRLYTSFGGKTALFHFRQTQGQ